jgi:hypothetical protein
MDIPEIKQYVRENWMRVSVIAGIALIGISLVVTGIVYVVHSRNVNRAPVTNVNAPGLPHAQNYQDLFAVSIDNHVDARPTTGLASASIVMELPVEGGITRFLALYERAAHVEKIGPVRSARPYFLDWTLGFGPALFVHFGGSPEALTRIASTPALREVDVDGMADGVTFWRDASRDAPHNAYTSTEKVGDVFAARSLADRGVPGYLVVSDPAVEDRGTAESISIPYSTLSYTPVWQYDRARNIYVRTVKGAPAKDESGEQLESKNIIVLETNVDTIDAVGRKKIVTTGVGSATVFHDGKKIDATWRRPNNETPPRFYGTDGIEIPLTEGNIWIEVVPKEINAEVK